MDIGTFITLYAIALPVFFVVDLLWLGVIAKKFYNTQLEPVMGNIRWGAAIGFYLIYIVGLVLFAIMPGYTDRDIMTGVLWGAAFGFFTYATYDMTNLATLKYWPIKVVVVDIVWGMVLGSTVTYLTLVAASFLL